MLCANNFIYYIFLVIFFDKLPLPGPRFQYILYIIFGYISDELPLPGPRFQYILYTSSSLRPSIHPLESLSGWSHCRTSWKKRSFSNGAIRLKTGTHLPLAHSVELESLSDELEESLEESLEAPEALSISATSSAPSNTVSSPSHSAGVTALAGGTR